jgi:hypothetical protein
VAEADVGKEWGGSAMYTNASGGVEPTRSTAWVGWIIFAAVAMVISGLFNITWGIVALVRDQVFVVGSQGNVFTIDYTAWGWVNLIVGVIVILMGLALLTGRTWALIGAVVLAVLSIVNNLFVLSAYPIWSVMIIAFDVLVIYAICVHGNEVKDF